MQNTQKKKILIFSTAYFPFVGGAEVAIRKISDNLSNDYDFDLITAKLDDRLKDVEKIGAVNVYRLGSGRKRLDKMLLPFRGAFFAFKLNRLNKYHCYWGVMVSFSSGAAFISNILSALVGQKKVPIVLSLQEGDSETHLKYKWGGLISLSWRLALSQTTVLTGLSNFLLDRAKKYGYKGSSVLLPNGVDTELFLRNISDQERSRLINNLDKKKDEVYLVTISRLARKNAVDDIISALKYLPENISLLVIGSGSDGNKLQEQVIKLELVNRVKFLGHIDYKDLPVYLSISDVFIRPSRSEGFGNSFIEAMAAGVPVIATPVGGIPDFLSDKKTGIFCSPDNPKSIADAVMFYLNNSKEKSEIVARAKDMAINEYSWIKVSKDAKEKVFDYIKGI
jgi:glycosyltransferase involved in cell wall biosynthesis